MSVGIRLRDFLFSLAKLPRVFWATALFGWIALLTILAIGKAPQLPSAPWTSFLWNFAHGPAYGLLAPLCLLCLPRDEGRIPFSPRDLAISFVLVLAVGISHELFQGMTSHRSFSLWDWASDAAGGISFLGLFRLCRDSSPSASRLALYGALSMLLCALPAWADSLGLSF